MTPVLFVDDGGCPTRGRQEVRQDIVVDVLLRVQNGARPLGFTIDRHGGRSVGSVGRSQSASRGGEAEKIRKPNPRVGYTRNSGRGETPVAPNEVFYPG